MPLASRLRVVERVLATPDTSAARRARWQAEHDAREAHLAGVLADLEAIEAEHPLDDALPPGELRRVLASP